MAYTIIVDWQGDSRELIEAKTLAEAGTAARAISLLDGIELVSVTDTGSGRLRNTYDRGQVSCGPDSAAMLSRRDIFTVAQ